jgi:acyl-CoA synthetase (AMP-forming)/AMP-acid ligase II
MCEDSRVGRWRKPCAECTFISPQCGNPISRPTMNVVEPIARQALARPEQQALVAGDTVLTYGGLMRRVARLANQLSQAGIVRGDLVGITTNGFFPQITLTLAIAWLGAVSISIARRNAPMAKDYGVKLIVHQLSKAGAIDAPGVRTMSMAELKALGDGEDVPLAKSEPDELFRYGMSSGTTGRPKAISYTHGTAILRCQSSRVMYPMDREERLMVFMGLELTFSVSFWLRTLSSGGTLVRCAQSYPETMEILRKERVTLLLTSPNHAIRLVELAKEPKSPYAKPPPHLRHLCVGGAVVVPGVQQLLRKHLCPNLGINYGASETGAVAVLDEQLQKDHPGCAGRLLPWVEVRVLDDERNPLPFGTVGRISVRSPIMASGYLQPAGDQPQDGDEAFADGWFNSGDRGALSSDGLVYLAGRSGEVLNVGGNKVDASVIEEVIARDSAVTECAVLVMQNPAGEQLLVALVVSAAKFDAKDVKKRCQEALGRRMTPAAVKQVERLPRNEAGKVIRQDLPALVGRKAAADAKGAAA